MLSSSSVTYLTAHRHEGGGVCTGTLWKSLPLKHSASKQDAAAAADQRNAVPVYAVLVAHALHGYESEVAFRRGDSPLHTWLVVGASAWSPLVKNRPSATTVTSLRLVTSQGTQVYCWTSTQVDRDTWLTALQAGLELSLAHPHLTPTMMTKVAAATSATADAKDEINASSPPRRSFFGRTASTTATSPTNSSSWTSTSTVVTQCPVCDRPTEPSTASSLPTFGTATTTTGLVPTVAPHTGWPIPQCATEDRSDALCVSCGIAQGVWHHVHVVQCLYAAMATERCILATAQRSCHAALGLVQAEAENAESKEGTVVATSSAHWDETALLEWLQTTECISWARQCSSFDKWRRDVLRSNNSLLGALSESGTHNENEIHLVSGTDFIEWLDEAAGGPRRPETIAAATLKQQAVRVAGDMGTAMQLLLEQAVVPTTAATATPSFWLEKSHGKTTPAASSALSTLANTEVLQCVLEFFLDLCDEGELSSVAFFWPQLCHIHLRMLPPVNAQSLARVELMEDFLMTVATRYSIHLCLELVWSHTADLEESLQVSSSSATLSSSSERVSSGTAVTGSKDVLEASAVSPACRRRRFSVVRFLCELESLLFDFDGGWGGGSVSLGKILSPSTHQVELLKQAAQHIQALRLETNYHVPSDLSDASTAGSPHPTPHNFLTRSARFDMLSHRRDHKPPEEQADEKLRIAKNADYFTCHVNFSKRLADIAEKLRFVDLADRAVCLEQELTLLNCSGTMGGDPLNRLREHLIRVARIPVTEGHVFRSKERTPVLLLMEVIDEMVSEIPPAQAPPPPPPPPPPIYPEETVPDEAHENGQAEPTAENPIETSVDDESAVDADDALATISTPVPSSPKRSAGSPRAMLEGALEGTRQSPGPKALKRFDKEGESAEPFTPTTPKSDVQLMVNSFAEEQLKEIEMPELIHGQATSEDQTSTQEDGAQVATGSPEKNVSFRPSPQRDEAVRSSRKMSTLVSAKHNGNEVPDGSTALARTGDIRRAVLTTIMMRGLQGNTIAAGAADSAQRSLKELERKRATELLLSDDTDASSDCNLDSDADATKQKFMALGLSPSLEEAELASRPTEEDEVMEAIRLILIQNQVAQGKLSQADAAKVLQHTSLSPINAKKAPPSFNENGGVDVSEHPTIDAGDVDSRLVGCGPLPPAALQAMTLWKGGMVTHAELLELVKKDIEFVKHSVLVDAENLDMLKENSAFWGRFAFGERWAEKKSRIGSSSPEGSIPGWDMMGVIVKSNDDLRQEAFVMQLIELCQEAFELADLELWVSPYRIIATGRSTGVIECVRNAMSFDALKKRPGYGKGGLREHLQRMTEFTADPGGAFVTAQQNFVRSLAAYSLMSYFFLFKDRHNGNLLLDTAGHVIHIDFGFVFGIAPGGSFSLEMSTPFKLTEEMLDVMGGLRSPLFAEFVTLFCCGFLALQLHCDTFLTLVEITSKDSTFKCFDGRETHEIVSKLRERFCPDLSKEDTISFALDLIKQATTSYGTRQYDLYQYLSQGIVA